MTITEQVKILAGLADNNFAQSLASQFASRGVLSDKQMYWVERLVTETLNPPVRPDINIDQIMELFDIAAENLKYPKVRITVDGKPLCFSRAGARSKHPGSINVTDGRRYGENTWYGRINGGKWEPSRRCENWVLSYIKEFANNPVGMMQAYGLMSGNCAFCAKGLTDGRSVAVGYGPICAKNWKLPWGEKT